MRRWKHPCGCESTGGPPRYTAQKRAQSPAHDTATAAAASPTRQNELLQLKPAEAGTEALITDTPESSHEAPRKLCAHLNLARRCNLSGRIGLPPLAVYPLATVRGGRDVRSSIHYTVDVSLFQRRCGLRVVAGVTSTVPSLAPTADVPAAGRGTPVKAKCLSQARGVTSPFSANADRSSSMG